MAVHYFACQESVQICTRLQVCGKTFTINSTTARLLNGIVLRKCTILRALLQVSMVLLTINSTAVHLVNSSIFFCMSRTRAILHAYLPVLGGVNQKLPALLTNSS